MDLQILDLSEGELLLRVGLAIVLGGAIGIEREIDAQAAGFRTHILLALGATLFGLISTAGFAPYVTAGNATNVSMDITRVASQVVVGIGFLGAGVIIRQGGSIRGVTTAASMWVTVAIGLALGIGYYWASISFTVAVLVTLVVFRSARERIRRRFGRQSEIVTFVLERGVGSREFLTALHALQGVNVRSLNVDREENQTVVVAGLKTDKGVILDPLLSELAERDDVDQFSVEER